MDLIEAIVTHFDSGTEAAVIALRGDVTVMLADVEPDTTSAMPYVIVQQLDFDIISKAETYRVEEIKIQFAVYASTRLEVLTILDLIDSAYKDKVLTVTGYTVLSAPQLYSRLSYWELDRWVGLLHFLYMLEK